MLRRIARLRAVTVPTAHIRHRTASAVALQEGSEERQDGYGMDYGAGPSRIPYEAQSRALTPIPASNSPLQQLREEPLPTGTVFAPASSLQSARLLRRRLRHATHGHYVNVSTFLQAVSSLPDKAELGRIDRRVTRQILALSRLELHALVHHLIRVDQPILAALLVSEAIQAGVTEKPRRRRLFALRTIEALLSVYPNVDLTRTPAMPPDHDSDASPHITAFTPNKQLVATPARPLSRKSHALLNLLASMQEVRHHRSPEMYRLLIKQCIQERRPDAAAKVFVGLVEEWVTEGRVAEGADVDDFCEGGGPNEKLEIQLVSNEMAAWWHGVRTWRLPGEVLSPHGRLDLWHPKNLSLGEKMKGFPMPVPTSPPSMVPAPSNDLLKEIIDSLHVDPTECLPEDHTASMRALAYLANTVLSRTLPLSSLRALFTAMSATKHRPAVYPESIDIEMIPESDRWAYESFTQIHLALQSLLSAPPMSATSIEYANQVERARKGAPANPVHPPPPPSPYMFHPLSWTSCLELLRYGMSRLRSPKTVRHLVVYMKQVFGHGHTSPKAHNVMLEGAIRLPDNYLGRMISKALFGSLMPGVPNKTPLSGVSAEAANQDIIPASHASMVIDHPDFRLDPDADERSLSTLIVHLTVTSSFAELESLVYDLIPFLSNDHAAQKESQDAAPPNHLPLALYPVLIEGMRKAGKTGLAQRLYKLALEAEAEAVVQHEQLAPETRRRAPPTRLPVELFTSMIGVWANEAKVQRGSNHWVKGWTVDGMNGVVKRAEAAPHMAWQTYLEARKRWSLAAPYDAKKRFRPGFPLYRALLKACERRWRLESTEYRSPAIRQELEQVVNDMKRFGIAFPDKAAKKLSLNAADMDLRYVPDTPERDPAIVLAEMFLSQGGNETEEPRRPQEQS